MESVAAYDSTAIMQVWRRFPALPWVLLVAAACRVAVFFAFPGVFDFAGTGTIHGSEAYDTYARNLLATGVYGLERGTPDAALPPAYGFVLAGIYGLFGRSSLAVAAVQTAFDLGTIALLAAVGGALFRSAAVGALAGVMTACYPYLVFQTLAVNDTALFLLELHAFVWLVVLVRDRPVADHPSVALAAAAGLVLGAGALTRPAILVVACGAAAWLGHAEARADRPRVGPRPRRLDGPQPADPRERRTDRDERGLQLLAGEQRRDPRLSAGGHRRAVDPARPARGSRPP